VGPAVGVFNPCDVTEAWSWLAARLSPLLPDGFGPTLARNYACSLFHDYQSVGGDVLQVFVQPAGPADGDVGGLFRAEAEVQS